MEVTREGLARFFGVALPHLDERQRRVVAGAMSEMLGHGGKTAVATASGMSRNTVIKAQAEVESGIEPSSRLREPGAGAKPLTEIQPGLLEALDELVNPETRGNPMSLLRWTSKSTAHLAKDLVRQGFRISDDTVGRLLKRLGYSLQAPAKQKKGTAHPDRDGQFHYLNDTASGFVADGQPVISVDTKKKELVGPFRNGGKELRPAGDPERVLMHDFVIDDADHGRVSPYGVYDLAANEAWVSVGTDHDTGAFAVESIRRWWQTMGQPLYPDATRLLVTADAGGSNGARLRLWKAELGKLADETGLEIAVCHFPPGTSKWNKIEHRLFSAITMNWRGKPLVSHEAIVRLIAATTTRTGLRVRSALDTRRYPKGVKVGDAEMEALYLQRDAFHGDWNYTLIPRELLPLA